MAKLLQRAQGDIVNPEPGTVVDDIVTRQERFDFISIK